MTWLIDGSMAWLIDQQIDLSLIAWSIECSMENVAVFVDWSIDRLLDCLVDEVLDWSIIW